METKKMWIIECVDVPEGCDLGQVMVYGRIKGDTVQKRISSANLIAPERLRYGMVEPLKEGLFVIDNFSGLVECDGLMSEGLRLIIDPPKPKETVKEVMSRMPDLFDDCWADTMDYEMINILKDWQSDLKKAQEG